MTDISLFAYGTLSNPEYIQLLLRRLPKFTTARLPGYGLFVHPQNGYLFAKPTPGHSVKGKLLSISHRELQLIDLWEEVPLYQPENLMVLQEDNKVRKAIVYSQNNTVGIPFDPIHEKDKQSIIQEIEEFMASIEKTGLIG